MEDVKEIVIDTKALLIISFPTFSRIDSHRFSAAPGNVAALLRKMHTL